MERSGPLRLWVHTVSCCGGAGLTSIVPLSSSWLCLAQIGEWGCVPGTPQFLCTTGWQMLFQSVTECVQPAYCAWSDMWHVTDRCMDYTFGHCTGLCAGCINSHCDTLTLCVFVLVAYSWWQSTNSFSCFHLSAMISPSIKFVSFCLFCSMIIG